MTFTDFISKTDVAKTVFQCGVTSALSVETATQEQKLAWIVQDLKKLEAELELIGKTFDEQDEVGDPFAEEAK